MDPSAQGHNLFHLWQASQSTGNQNGFFPLAISI